MNYEICFPGDAASPSTFGGATYYFLQGFASAGLEARGLNLSISYRNLKRVVWNLIESALGRGAGGFQYSDSCLKQLFSKVAIPDNGVIINLFQVYSPEFFVKSPETMAFYIDQTLTQLFEFYPESAHISHPHRIEAVSKERAQYEGARVIFCMCDWARKSLELDYGIDRAKICVVPPGANIDIAEYEKWNERRYGLNAIVGSNTELRKLKIVFVGKDASRKGLNRVLEALLLLPDLQDLIQLSVIGCSQHGVATHLQMLPGVTWYGSIDKFERMGEFLDLVGAHDLGILLSTAEATGLSLREFQALGLGVIAPDVGGAPEMVAEGAGILVLPNSSAASIAMILKDLYLDENKVKSLRAAAFRARRQMLWSETARLINARLSIA